MKLCASTLTLASTFLLAQKEFKGNIVYFYRESLIIDMFKKKKRFGRQHYRKSVLRQFFNITRALK